MIISIIYDNFKRVCYPLFIVLTQNPPMYNLFMINFFIIFIEYQQRKLGVAKDKDNIQNIFC